MGAETLFLPWRTRDPHWKGGRNGLLTEPVGVLVGSYGIRRVWETIGDVCHQGKGR